MAHSARSPGIYYGWVIVGVCAWIGFFALGGRTFGLFIKPLSDEFGWDRATISIAASVSMLVGGFMQPFSGRIFDKFGGRRVMTISLFFVALSTIALYWTNSLIFLVGFYGVVMPIFFSGTSMMVINPLVSRWFQKNRTTAISIANAGFSLGSLSLLPVMAIVMQKMGWRDTWLVVGLITLISVPMAALLIRDDPSQKGLQSDGLPAPPKTAGRSAKAPEVRAPLETIGWREAFRSAPIWQMAFSFFICGFTSNVVFVHLIPLSIERGLSPTVAATAVGFMGALNIVGMLTTGILADRMERRTLLALIYATRGLSYIIIVLVSGPWAIFFFAAVVGFAMVATGPLTTGLAADIYGLRHLGTLMGIAFLFHQVGGAISIYLAGRLRDLTGDYNLAFIIIGLSAIVATVLSLAIKERRYSARFQPVAAKV